MFHVICKIYDCSLILNLFLYFYLFYLFIYLFILPVSWKLQLNLGYVDG